MTAYPYRWRYRRCRKVSAKDAVAPVVVGLLVAAVASHAHAPAHAGHAADSLSPARTAPAPRATGNEALANQMAASGYGWTGGQVTCLDELWRRESGFSQYADTRKSGLDAAHAQVFAYGIAQARPATKYPAAGRPADLGGSSDPAVQVSWGLGYIAAVYRTPCGAWAHEEADSWY